MQPYPKSVPAHAGSITLQTSGSMQNQSKFVYFCFMLKNLEDCRSSNASVQDALGSAPLVGDLAGIKAREEFIPSSKAEKHAARLHAEAGRLYNEEE